MPTHPYREAKLSRAARPGRSGDPEVAIIYALGIFLGGARLIIAFATHEILGAEASIAALLAAAGAIGWLRDR